MDLQYDVTTFYLKDSTFSEMFVEEKTEALDDEWFKTSIDTTIPKQPNPPVHFGNKPGEEEPSEGFAYVGDSVEEHSNEGTSIPLSSRVKPYGIELTGLLGKGHFGEVWKGFYRGKSVAVKLLQSSAEQAKWE